MAYFTHIKDETKPHNKIVEAVPNGIRLVDFLKKQELVNPQIFLNGNLLFSEDGEILIDIDDNYRLKEDDNLLVVNTLKGASILVSAVATILVSTVVSYAISALLAPDKPSIPNVQNAKQQKGETEYSISTSQNMAKKGEPIPECFGEFVRYPDLISAPYYRYHNNEEYLYMLMCVGKGTYSSGSLYIEDSSVDTLNLGDFKYIFSKLDNGLDDELNTTWSNQNFQYPISQTFSILSGIIPEAPGGFTSPLISLIWESAYKFVFSVTFGGSISEKQYHHFRVYFYLYDDKGTVLAIKTKDISESQFFGVEKEYYITIDEVTGAEEVRAFYTVFPDSENTLPFSMDSKRYYYYTGGSPTQDTYMQDIVVTSNEIENIEVDASDKLFPETTLNSESLNLKAIEFDVLFPNGLYSQDSNGVLQNRTVNFDLIFLDSAGVETVNNENVTANSRDPIRKTFRYLVNGTGAYTVKVVRTNSESQNNRIAEKLIISRVKGYAKDSGISKVNYKEDTTYLAVRIKSTSGISAKGQFKVKFKGERASLKTLNECISHIYTTENGGRQDPQNLDLPSMPENFNHVFEKRGTVYQAMNTVARSGNYNLYPSFNKITAKKDEPQPIPSFMFNESNIIKGTLKISKTVRAETDYDGMKGIYKDAETFEEKTIVFPETAIFPQELPLDGVTDDTIALDRTKFAWYQGIYRNTKYEFDTTLVGHIPSLFTKCQIAHNSISNSIPNQLIGYTTNTVTLRDTIKTDGTYTHIVFRDRQGAPSALFQILSINENVLTLDVSSQALPVADFYIGDDELKTMCQVGTSATFIKDIMLTEIKPKRGNKISIKAFNYDERVYQ